MRTVFFCSMLLTGLALVELAAATPSTTGITNPDVDFERCMTLFSHHKYEAAQEALKSYSAQHPQDPTAVEATYYAAVCAIRLERVDGEEQLQQFIKDYPYHAKANLAYYELGKLYADREACSQAIAFYRLVDTTQLTPDLQAEVQYRLAYAYLNEKDFDQALAYFNPIKNGTSPYAPVSNYYAGYLALKKGDYSTALADLHRAEKDPAYQPVVPYLIIEVYYQAQRFQELVTYAAEIQSNAAELKNQVDIALLTADAYFFLGNYTAAAQYYEAYLDLQPTEVSQEGRYRLGYALYRLDEPVKALKYLQKVALQTDKLAQLASYYMGLTYIKINQKNQALSAFDHARHLTFISEIQQEATFQYAQLSCELGNFKIALEVLQKFKQDYPKSAHIPAVDNLLTQLYFNSHNYERTIAYIEGLATKSDAILRVYQKATFYKGSTCFNQEDYAGAVQWLQKSLTNPRDGDLLLPTRLWLAESYTAQQAYEQATQQYQTVLASGQKSSIYYNNACYGMAYVYFNTNNYQQALPLFRAYVSQSKDEKDPWRMDALVRTADCYYMTRSYTNALAAYDTAEAVYPVHSYYQKALIYDLQHNRQASQQYLNMIIKDYQQTPYYEKALFAYARMALKYQDYPLAVTRFTTFLEKKPYSPLVPEALLNRALANVNQRQNSDACIDYEQLLTHYPTHPAAQSAVLELSKLLIEADQAEKMQTYLEKYKNANPTSQTVEGISFEAAKNLFYSQRYPQALEQLHEFIKAYPASNFLNEASFLLAETYYRLGKESEALTHYHLAAGNKNTPFYNRILLRLAGLTYKQKDFKEALQYYTELHERASSKKETYYALEGMMKSSDALQEYDSVKQAASLILQEGNITINSVNQATLYLGKVAMEQQKIPEALDHFKQIVSKDQDIYAAEAQYWIARIYHQLGDYQQSLENLFILHKKFSEYPEWLNQGFLLMADDYIALQEFFQARATLQSIIDHAGDTLVVEQATQKLQMLQQQASEDSLAQAAQAQIAQETSEFKTIEGEFKKPDSETLSAPTQN